MKFMSIALHHNDDSHIPVWKYAQKLCHRYSFFGTNAFLLRSSRNGNLSEHTHRKCASTYSYHIISMGMCQ